MISCRTVAELISKEQDAQLRLAQRVNLEIHVFLCVGCRRFRRQLKFVDNALKEYFSSDLTPALEFGLTTNAKKRLESIIDQRLSDE